MELPSKLKIDDMEYSVVQKTNFELQDQEKRADIFFYGLTDSQHSTIYINSELSDNEKEITLIHEMIHAILFERGFDDVNGEHYDRAVDAVAHGLRMAARQNDLDAILKGEDQQ